MSFRDILGDVIPERHFTRANGVAAALLLSALVFGVAGAWRLVGAAIWPKPPVECFDSENPVAEAPALNVYKAFDRVFAQPESRQALQRKADEEMTQAERNCPAPGCGWSEAAEYRQALAHYLTERGLAAKTMQQLAGKAGLEKAVNFYRRPADRQIEAGMRARFAAKLFNPSALEDAGLREMAAILLFRGADAVRACGRLD